MSTTEQAGLGDFERVRRNQESWIAEQKAQAEARQSFVDHVQHNVKCDPRPAECPQRSIVDRLHAEARQLDQTIDRYRQVAELAMLLEKHPDVARIFELYYKVGI